MGERQSTVLTGTPCRDFVHHPIKIEIKGSGSRSHGGKNLFNEEIYTSPSASIRKEGDEVLPG
jgi:hypothetical protein